jgi:hypothetical protein
MGDDSLMPGSSSGNTAWIMRELTRLEKQKADKAYVTQLEKLLQEKGAQHERSLEDSKLSFARDINGLKRDIETAQKAAEDHPCLKEEEFSEMNATLAKLSTAHEDMLTSQKTLTEAQTFWSRWFMKGMIGFILFLLGTGGVWVYSYVNIKYKSEEAQKTSTEVKALVSEVQQTQKAQAETLKQVAATKETRDDAAMLQIRQELKQAMKEVLADNAANR